MAIRRQRTFRLSWKKTSLPLVGLLMLERGENPDSLGAPLSMNCRFTPGKGIHWLDIPQSDLPDGSRIKITLEVLPAKS